jgi:hypothetical protein
MPQCAIKSVRFTIKIHLNRVGVRGGGIVTVKVRCPNERVPFVCGRPADAAVRYRAGGKG